MALEHAILVSLSEKSASGYELAQRFDASIGHFWRATHQQIYRVLARMEADKFVAAHLVAQGGRPDKKVYEITGEGRRMLVDWLAEPSGLETLRSEFTVKLRALHLADPATARADIAARRQASAALLDDYRAAEAAAYPDPAALPTHKVGPYLALRGGIRTAASNVQWCDEILSVLDQRPR